MLPDTPDPDHTAEPVRVAAAIQTLIGAVIALALIFGLIDWTGEQVGAVIAVYVAAVGVWNAVVTRNKVTPV